MASTTLLLSAALTLVATWAALSLWALAERYIHDRALGGFHATLEALAAGSLDLRTLSRSRLSRIATDIDPLAAEAAARMLYARDEQHVLRRAQDGRTTRARLRGLTVLVRSGSPAAVELLDRALTKADGNHAQMTRLLRLAGELHTEAADTLLLKTLILGVHPRARTATELEPRAHRLRTELIALTSHADPLLRYWALTLLTRAMSDAAAALAATSCAGDSDASVRAAAAEALGGVDRRVARPLLRRLLQDDVFFVRSHAARSVAAAHDETLAALLLPLLADANWWVRAAAKESLLQLGSKGLEVAVAALAHPDRFARDGALEIIVGSGRATELLPAAEAGDSLAQSALAAIRSGTARPAGELPLTLVPARTHPPLDLEAVTT